MDQCGDRESSSADVIRSEQSDERMSEQSFLMSMMIVAHRVGTERNVAWCEVCLRYFTKSLHTMVFMQTVYSTVVRGNSNWVCDKGVNLTDKERV